MPNASPKPCKRCKTPTRSESGFCPGCESKRTAGFIIKRETYDARRGSASSRGYGRRWQRESKAFLKVNPLCVICHGKGVVKAASCVDHIKPHKGDKKLFWARSNWQGLCNTCHNKKTATENGGFGHDCKDWK